MKYFITDFRVRLKCTSQFPQFMLVNHLQPGNLHHTLLATGRGNCPQHCMFRLTSCGNQPPNPFGLDLFTVFVFQLLLSCQKWSSFFLLDNFLLFHVTQSNI